MTTEQRYKQSAVMAELAHQAYFILKQIKDNSLYHQDGEYEFNNEHTAESLTRIIRETNHLRIGLINLHKEDEAQISE